LGLHAGRGIETGDADACLFVVHVPATRPVKIDNATTDMKTIHRRTRPDSAGLRNYRTPGKFFGGHSIEMEV
jgi:hypothetical protein